MTMQDSIQTKAYRYLYTVSNYRPYTPLAWAQLGAAHSVCFSESLKSSSTSYLNKICT